jgi:hypothetical protein
MVEITYQMMLSTLQTIALIVGITYYLFIMRNSQRNQELTRKAQEQTLETRQAQLFTNIYNQSFANPEFLEAVRMVITTHWDNLDEFHEDYDYYNPNPSNPEFIKAMSSVNGFFEGLGVFVKEGLIDIRLIALTMTVMIKSLWEKIAPYVVVDRERLQAPRLLSEFEYLYNELMKYIEEHPELKS